MSILFELLLGVFIKDDWKFKVTKLKKKVLIYSNVKSFTSNPFHPYIPISLIPSCFRPIVLLKKETGRCWEGLSQNFRGWWESRNSPHWNFGTFYTHIVHIVLKLKLASFPCFTILLDSIPTLSYPAIYHRNLVKLSHDITKLMIISSKNFSSISSIPFTPFVLNFYHEK